MNVTDIKGGPYKIGLNSMDLLIIWYMSSVEAQCWPVQKLKTGEIMLTSAPHPT